MTKLRECPFCGDAEHLYIEHVVGTIIHPAYYVRCDCCGARAGSTDRGDHVEEWNRRAGDRYTLTDAGRKAMGGGE